MDGLEGALALVRILNRPMLSAGTEQDVKGKCGTILYSIYCARTVVEA
jgi:hypothetical protein